MTLAVPVPRPPTPPSVAARSKRSARPPLVPVAAPELSVVIVNYHQWGDTGALVRQLTATSSVRKGLAEVVVVDNHSPLHPLVSRLRRRRGVSLRRWRRNRGFARAVNEGCRLSRGKWFLLINPDVTVEPDFLDEVLALAGRLEEQDPAAGIIGFQLRNSNGSRQLSAGPFPTLLRTLVGLALPRYRRKYSRLAPPRRCRVPWVTGCCLLVRRDCLAELGGLDEDFFLYYEDVDLCLRAREHGWTVWHEPALRVTHHRPLHTRAVPPHLRVVTRHALLTYAAKHWTGWQLRWLAACIRAEAWLRQAWAWWHGEAETAELCGDLRAIAADVAFRRTRRARRRLDRVIRRQEERVGT